MSHTRKVCQHGVAVSQCRCIEPHKVTEVVRPCPFGVEHLGMVVVHPKQPTAGGQEPAQLPAGAPETPEPVSQDGPGPEEIYRGAMNRYFRNVEFQRKVDQTVQLAMAALGRDLLDEAGKRDLRLGVMFGVYQAGG